MNATHEFNATNLVKDDINIENLTLENKDIRIICGVCYEFTGEFVKIKGVSTRLYKSSCGKSLYFTY